jgi:hypothetical protein
MMELAPTLERGIQNLAACDQRWNRALQGGMGPSSFPGCFPHQGEPLLLLAAMFNATLVFCVVNAPGVRSMALWVSIPIGFLSSTALLERGTSPYAGIVCGVLFVLALVYGSRVQGALGETLAQCYMIWPKSRMSSSNA